VTWSDDLADPMGGTMLCHNDVCPENVVFRGGRAVALLDFEFAAPGRPVWDIAMTARFWVPLTDPETSTSTGRQHLDRAARLRLFVEAYGLPRVEWPAVVPMLQTINQVARSFVMKQMASDHGEMRRAHEELGFGERWDRNDRWVAEFSWI